MPKIDAMAIGRKLKDARLARGETMEQVSECLNISKSAMAMYETGRRVPRDTVKIALARHYDVTVEYLFFAS